MSRKKIKIKRKSDNKQCHTKNQNEPQDIESHKWLAKAELFRLRDYKFPCEDKTNTINRNNNKIFGDFNVKVLDYKPPHDIATRDDLEKLNRKIEFRIKNYSLDSLLLMIHDTYLSERSFPFVAGMMTKYALLNCEVETGYSIYDEKDVSIYKEEFLELQKMITGYSAYDPDLEQVLELRTSRDKRVSFIFRKIGSQSRWNIPIHNMLGRTIYLLGELSKSDKAPLFIKNLVEFYFEAKFNIPLLDFIKIGFVLFAGSNKPGGLTRNYLEIARNRKMPIASDEIINRCLEQVACYPEQFRNLCKERDAGEEFLRVYKFNPLFLFPIIRPWKNSHMGELKNDRFIAPIPELIIYRFTTGLYYQLFNDFKLKFTQAFGKLFELYVGKILEWYKLPGVILSESDISLLLPKYKGKKPDWIILGVEGIILIECKATKYSQDIYEHGVNARNDSMGFIKHIHNAIDQLNELESQVPLLKEKYGFSSPNSDIIKLIVSFEPLPGLKEGPIREWVEEEKKNEGLKMNWIVIWVGELEEAQPYISTGANFWSFLKDYWEKDFNSILMEMKSKTGSSYKEGILYQYEEMIFKELLKNAPSSKAQYSLLNS